MCNLIGLVGFVELIRMADINPIYMCQHPLFHNGCLVQECTSPSCANVIDMKADPEEVPPRKQLTVSAVYEVTHPVGAGTVSFSAFHKDDSSIVEGPYNYLIPSFKPGVYRMEYYFMAFDFFKPGIYTGRFLICEGYCGSRFPHTSILDSRTITFTIHH